MFVELGSIAGPILMGKGLDDYDDNDDEYLVHIRNLENFDSL